MTSHPLLKQSIIVGVLAAIGGISVLFISQLLGQFVATTFEDSFRGFSGLGLAFIVASILRVVTFALSALIVGALLLFAKVRRAVFITLFATISITASVELVRALASGPQPIVFLYLVAPYVFFYEFYWLLFNVIKTKIYIPLVLSALVAVGAYSYLPKLGRQVSTQRFEARQEEDARKIDIAYYAPRHSIGRFVLDKVNFNYYPPTDKTFHSWVELHFMPGLFVNVFRAPEYFNPPANCGDYEPSVESISLYKCRTPITTNKNRIIYPASQLDYPKPEKYFVKIDNTVLAIHSFPKDMTNEELKEFVDAFEPVSYEELKALGQAGEQSRQERVNNVAQYVKFTLYIPTYLPPDYQKTNTYLGNVKDPTDPIFKIMIQSKRNEQSTISEWKSKMVFDPPKSCGNIDAEFESNSSLSYGCKFLLKTPKGISVYQDTSYTLLFMIGDTKVSIFPLREGQLPNTEIAKIIDSMVETPPNQIELSKN